MTLHEAIGVHRCDIDTKTGERLTHSDIYGRAIDLLGGLDAVAQYIPFPMDVIRRALKTDPHLNNTSMRRWDEAAGFQCGVFGNRHRGQAECRPTGDGLWNLYRQHGITGASCAEGVCILKEAARRLVAREGGASG